MLTEQMCRIRISAFTSLNEPAKYTLPHIHRTLLSSKHFIPEQHNIIFPPNSPDQHRKYVNYRPLCEMHFNGMRIPWLPIGCISAYIVNKRWWQHSIPPFARTSISMCLCWSETIRWIERYSPVLTLSLSLYIAFQIHCITFTPSIWPEIKRHVYSIVMIHRFQIQLTT